MTMAETVNKILDRTKEGSASGWVDRIAIMVQQAGMETAEICWQGSPLTVAVEVWEHANQRGHRKFFEELSK